MYRHIRTGGVGFAFHPYVPVVFMLKLGGENVACAIAFPFRNDFFVRC